MKRRNISIACIGQGFVGGSLTTVLDERGIDVFVYDKMGKVAPGGVDLMNPVPGLDLKKARKDAGIGDVHNKDPEELTPVRDFVKLCEEHVNFSKIFFVCLPTPMRENGEADLSIVESVLRDLALVPGERIAVIKSTVPPGSTEKWNTMFEPSGLHIIFNPEFLTEATALDDMRNQNRIVLGGPRPWINQVRDIYKPAFPTIPIVKTSSTTAEFIKYVTNVHLTVKVALANEFCQLCEALDKQGMNIDYDKVVEYATLDERIGSSHWSVPGPDGHRGFGGSCFVKDINALIYVAKAAGVDPKIMTAAWEKNLEVRPERDWEKLVGRAVSKK